MGRGGLYWPGPPQLPVYRSQWKFIFPIGHISFRKGLDSMLKLIRNYINPIGFAVYTTRKKNYDDKKSSRKNDSACSCWRMGQQLVTASQPASDSPAAAAKPAGRPALHVEVLAVPAPTLERSAAVHNHRDVLRLHLARPGNLGLLLFRWQGDIVAGPLTACPERVRLVQDRVDDGVVASLSCSCLLDVSIRVQQFS